MCGLQIYITGIKRLQGNVGIEALAETAMAIILHLFVLY